MPGVADNAMRTSHSGPSFMHAMNVRLNVRILCASSTTHVPHFCPYTVCWIMRASCAGALIVTGSAHFVFSCDHSCCASFSMA